MAGNRIDMIERAAARLRRDAPSQKPVIDQKPSSQEAAAAPPVPAVGGVPAAAAVPTPEVVSTPDVAPATPAVQAPNAVPAPNVVQSPKVVSAPSAAAAVSVASAPNIVPITPTTPIQAPPMGAFRQPTLLTPAAPLTPAPPEKAPEPAEHQAKHSRTVVLDTARLTLAGTVDWTSDRTPVMEELRLIKRRLLRRAFDCDRSQNPLSHLVMITSAKPREGKTFVAMNIAISISLEEDYNVLLVDADIRRQALRQNLGLEASQGFVDLLLNPNLDMADVMLKTNIPRLSVLPAGTLTDRAPELLASGRMRDLINDMANRYRDRIIIFDTAPCLVSSDAATLAAHVGQVVFVVEAEQTQQHEIIAALNLISACPEISLILNKAQPLATTSYDGYGAY
jgi:receptor protein-tyrosine kinase